MKQLFFFLSTIVLLASCKKDNVENPANMEKNLIKATYVWDGGTPEVDEYTYDVKGRLSVQKDDTRTYTFNYVSATSLIVTERNTSDNSLKQTQECILNDKGYITKMVFKNPAGAITYNYNYFYNADGYVTRLEGFGSGGGYEIDYTIVNGNLVSTIHYNDGILNRTGEYTYDNSKLNKTAAGYSGYWQSNKLFGKGTKNLLSEYKSKSPAGAITWHTQYAYEMDAAGYPAKLTTSNILTGKQGVDTYIYK